MSPNGSAERPPRAAWRGAHVILLGLPGAGKSTVGPLVAKALQRPFLDLDVEIERRAGRTVAEIFADEGEAAFRAHERALTVELLGPGSRPLVLAPGGGWVENQMPLDGIQPPVITVYLRVSTAVALARLQRSAVVRPLLAGSDPGGRLEEIMTRRESLYRQANHVVNTDSMTPEEVAASIVALASTGPED